LDDILKGKYPEYPIWKLKQRLLNNGYMLEKCNECGFEEKRITDGKVPLVLDFEDGDRKNHKYENLRMLCFNCSFLINGNLTGPRKEYEY
jgi:5-methylcytosine-specific restriction endonuclease McrA